MFIYIHTYDILTVHQNSLFDLGKRPHPLNRVTIHNGPYDKWTLKVPGEPYNLPLIKL